LKRYLIGTSGWIYKDWAKRFYPTDLKNEQKLTYYAKHFSTVEINNSFYRLPSEKNFSAWRDQVPAGFKFSVKLSRFLTHIKRLKVDADTDEGVDRFCSRVRCLKGNFGVVLVQLPPNFKASQEKVQNLSEQFKKAELKYNMQFPLALEMRHESWFEDKYFEQLESLNIASVVNSSPSIWPSSRRLTANFAYLRFHGSKKLYASSYSDKELTEWASFMKQAKGCKNMYAYFNNDKSAKAVLNAEYLKSLLS
jgi:uncharacterized protein YecE (DUF72 family)